MKLFSKPAILKLRLELRKRIYFQYGIPIILYLALHHLFETFFTSVLVDPVLSAIEGGIVNDIIFYAVVAYLLLLTLSKSRDYIASGKALVFSWMIMITYLYYRCLGDIWTFESLLSVKGIRYADLLVIITALETSVWLIALKRNYLVAIVTDPLPPSAGTEKKRRYQRFVQKKEKKQDDTRGFYNDSSVNEIHQDELGFYPYVLNLVEELKLTYSDKAFAIGINGKWGSGKTSFLNLIKKEMKGEDAIIIDFNPWRSHNPKAIMQDFFETIQKELSTYHSRLPALISDYADKIINLHSDGMAGFIKEVKSTIVPAESLTALYGDINSSLSEIDKRIFVFIDDVDRLDHDEIAEVIRLIRNTANFRNTFFIVAYDRSYVIHSLEKANTYNNNAYLEKIFQLEINLPYFELKVLRRKLADKLIKRMPDDTHAIIEKDIVGTDSMRPMDLASWVITLRDVSRLANGLLLNLRQIFQEVEFSEYVQLEILRQKFPVAYEMLYTKWDEYFNPKTSLSGRSEYYLVKSKFNIPDKPPQEITELEKQLRENKSQLKLSNFEIAEIIKLIDDIFGESTLGARSRNEMSIVNTNRYKIYFSYYLLDTFLPLKEFEEARAGTVENFYQKVEDWEAKEWRIDTINKLNRTQIYRDRQDFEKLTRVIFYMARKRFKGRQYKWDFKKLADRLDNYQKKLTKKLYGGKDKEYLVFLRDLLNTAPSPYTFEADFLEYLNDHSIDYFPLDATERMNYCQGYLRKYTETMTSWDDYVIWELYHACDNSKSLSESKNPLAEQYKFHLKRADIMKEAILRLPDSFFRTMIETFHNKEDRWVVNHIVSNVFVGWSNFGSFLARNKFGSSEYAAEFKAFYEKFKEADHSEAIEFDFKVIPVKRPKKES